MKCIASLPIASLPLCLIASLAVVAPLGAQIVQRDTLAVPKGNAVVSGVVMTDDATPQPLRRAQVTITSTDQPVLKTVFTDAAGRFSVADLPAGKYSLSAVKGGYVRMSYGAKRHNRPGTPINLGEGQRLTGLNLRLPKGGVITGTIVDETGLPAVGAQVRLLEYRV